MEAALALEDGRVFRGRAFGATAERPGEVVVNTSHPVKELRSGRVTVTSQNHGYAVDPESLPAEVEVTHLNLNHGTCEGFAHRGASLLGSQYHPESSPGPHDSLGLFREFHTMAARHATEVRSTRGDER
jgi:carbamoylphosphate synthase small subunit